jgi:hypothetical protein
VRDLRDARAVTESIGPLTLALPMIAAAFRTDWSIADNSDHAGWIVLGAPAACGLLALGVACLARSHSGDQPLRGTLAPLLIAASTFAGAVLLLLGAAHHLTIWAGQCAFAAGAVLLWMNSPDFSGEHSGAVELRASGGVSLMLLCGVIQALAVGFASQSMLNIAAGLILMHVTMVLALASGLASPIDAIRMGAWAATLALLLGLGAISLRHMLPRAIAVMQGVHDRPPLRVAYGFGAFALEASIMLTLGALAIGLQRVPAAFPRRIIGGVLIVAAAVLAGWRLAAA